MTFKPQKIVCSNCGTLLAKAKYKVLPPFARATEFESYGDKSKIFDFTEDAFFEEDRQNFKTFEFKWLVNLNCKKCEEHNLMLKPKGRSGGLVSLGFRRVSLPHHP